MASFSHLIADSSGAATNETTANGSTMTPPTPPYILRVLGRKPLEELTEMEFLDDLVRASLTLTPII
jgi:hypothetical protein